MFGSFSFFLSSCQLLGPIDEDVFLGKVKKDWWFQGNVDFAVLCPWERTNTFVTCSVAQTNSGRGSFSAGPSPGSGIANASVSENWHPARAIPL
jgi:hypothetical protein